MLTRREFSKMIPTLLVTPSILAATGRKVCKVEEHINYLIRNQIYNNIGLIYLKDKDICLPTKDLSCNGFIWSRKNDTYIPLCFNDINTINYINQQIEFKSKKITVFKFRNTYGIINE